MLTRLYVSAKIHALIGVLLTVCNVGATLSDLTLTLCHVGEGTLPALCALKTLCTLELHHCTGLTAVAVVAFCAFAPQVLSQDWSRICSSCSRVAYDIYAPLSTLILPYLTS